VTIAYWHAAARRDLLEHYVYLAENAGESVADRFLQQAEAAVALLAGRPQLGAPLTLSRAELSALRKWQLDGFENHLIFYRPHQQGIAIVRVLHAARDWWGLLELPG